MPVEEGKDNQFGTSTANPQSIQFAGPTADQVEYLNLIRHFTDNYDANVLVGGPPASDRVEYLQQIQQSTEGYDSSVLVGGPPRQTA